jgi:hypothetical protein
VQETPIVDSDDDHSTPLPPDQVYKDTPSPIDIPAEPQQSSLPLSPAPRRSTKVSCPPIHLSDYLCNLSQNSPSHSSTGILYPISDYHSYANISESLRQFSHSLVTDVEPKNYKEASNIPCWVKAMQSEIDALNKNKTWIFVDKPTNITPIGSK